MKRRNFIIVMGLVIIFGFSGYFIANMNNEGRASVNSEEVEFNNGMEEHVFNDNHMVLDAKTDEFNTLEDVENESDIIVLGTKVNQSETIVQRDGLDNILIVYTLSDFKIDTIIEGEIDKSKTIQVFENAGYDKKTNMNYNIAGYEMMEKGEKYLLFLRKSDTHDNYIPSGLSYGKVPLKEENSPLRKSINSSNSEVANEWKEKYSHMDKIHQSALNKYQEKFK